MPITSAGWIRAASVTFPKAYNNIPYVLATIKSASTEQYFVRYKTKTSFDIYLYIPTPGTGTFKIEFDWIAIGN